MMKCGCIGKKLTHSFSREIHALLADYSYTLMELKEDEIPAFFCRREFDAINVTIPYKQTVIPYLDWISDAARRIGAVNTIVNRDGKLWGYNTDYYGMKALLDKAGIEVRGRKVLILGTGGTSKTARVLAADLGAAEVLLVSRSKAEGVITYAEAVTQHADARVIINTTPCGMYPDCETVPIDVAAFADLEGVIDAVYNPLNTNLILEAKARGVRAEGGLYMLVMQAVAAAEKFLGREIDRADADRVFAKIYAAKENIVLIGAREGGMRAAGRALQRIGFELMDVDDEIERKCGCSIGEMMQRNGEEGFRDLEAEVIRAAASGGGRIIVLGGDALRRAENVQRLKRNGRLFAACAAPCREAADVLLPDLKTAEETADYILQKRMELIL